MKQSLQGEGTYTYECDKASCFHCLWTAHVVSCELPEILKVSRIFMSPKFNSKWTTVEDEVLLLHNHMPNNYISQIIGRPVSSVKSRRKILSTYRYKRTYSLMKPFYI